MYELIDSGVYDRTDDFTVVVQPVFEDSVFDVQVTFAEFESLTDNFAVMDG